MNFQVLVSVYNISGYLIACLEALSRYADIAVIETPCKGISKGILAERVLWIDRTGINKTADIDVALGDFNPNVFFCGGWMDKICVQYAKLLHKRGVRTVILADTPWRATARQFIHCLYSRLYLTRIFDFAWVAGEPQERYFQYLGFPKKRIRRGYYCANTNKFAPIGVRRERRYKFDRKWPHVFLYIGRYVEAKNMRRMEHAFIKAVEGTDWILRCIGHGMLWDERTIHPQIEHLGYKRPDEIQGYIEDAGCFVLPSTFEPWGVVVHEAALMGLPMICSKRVMATTAFLKDGENGFLFDPSSEDAISEAFCRIVRMPDEELALMGLRSHDLGMRYTTNDWVATILGMR